MHPRILAVRLWLERNDLFPKGKLALVTLYFVALDIFLYGIQKISQLVRPSYGNALRGWTLFLSFVVALLLCVLAARWSSSRLLWRLRNRLIVTYVFIGVIPALLLIIFAGLAFYLFSSQFATYIVTSRLDSELKALQNANQGIASRLATALNSKKILADAIQIENGGQVSAWIGSKVLVGVPADLVLQEPPERAFSNNAQAVITRDGSGLFIRSAVRIPTSAGVLAVASSIPLDRHMLLRLAANLGALTLEESSENGNNQRTDCESGTNLNPVLIVGAVPAQRRMFDRPVNFSTCVSVMNWRDGQVSNSAAIDVQTTLFALGDHLFSAPGAFAASIEVGLLLVATVLGAMVVMALYIGTRLTRSITRSVAQLYLATTHINRGDFSHRIPIRSKDQLAALAGSFNLMTESIEKLILEQKEKQRLQNEITIAQEVQSQLFPRHITQLPSLEVHGFCRPARSVSGDYYDFLPLGAAKLMLAVGDVSGKGISAALLMATIHSAVRAYSMEGIPALRQVQVVGAGPALIERYDSILPGAEIAPGTLLSLLNHQLVHTTPMEKYATMFLAVYDGAHRTLTFSNAGHLPPLLLSESGAVRKLEDGGTVVGLFDDLNFDEGSVQLRPGEIFLAYSDGVTEPENDFGEFGEQRLIELVHENRDLSLERISEIVTAAVDDWIGGAEQPDDITLVLARAR
jgi:sigma-B regulation protein RsbU (phosphoserine phosphatase)